MRIKKLFIAIASLMILGEVNVFANVQGTDVNLVPGKIDNTPLNPEGGKAPVIVPSAMLDGYTLYIDGINADYTLELIDENDTVVYSTYVPSSVNVVVLPSTLSGNFELRLYPGGSYYFYGYISL